MNEEKRFGFFPDKVANALQNIEKVFGIEFEVDDCVVLRNRGGWAYAKGKGLTYSYCTSSMIDGPGYDYSKEFGIMLEALGFRCADSYGDNGMDSAKNWSDTYWNYDYIYEPSMVELTDEAEIGRLSQPICTEYYY